MRLLHSNLRSLSMVLRLSTTPRLRASYADLHYSQERLPSRTSNLSSRADSTRSLWEGLGGGRREGVQKGVHVLCRLAIRRISQPDSRNPLLVLRVAGQHTLGSAGTLGSDQKSFSSSHELLRAMTGLGIEGQVLAAAEIVMQSPEHLLRFVTVGDGVQIPFARLQDLGLDLFE